MRTIYTSQTARQVQEMYQQIYDLQLSSDADQYTRERVDQSIQNIISRVRNNMLTHDTGWLPLGANIAEAEDVHAFSYRNKTELKKGHAFWTENWLPEGLDKDDKVEVNKQVLTALNSLLGLLRNSIKQTSDAAIAYPLATLEKNLAQTDVRIKQALLNKLEKIRDTETDFNQQTLLDRKISLLRSFMDEPMSATASTSTSDTPAEAVSALTQTLTNIFNRRTCITLIEDTMPDMLENGTFNFVDLLGYCGYSLQQDKNGDYLDPEKIDTLVGLLAESAQAYGNNASCAAGIVERCQRDGYIIAQSSALSQSHQTEQEVLENILTQVREASVGNKLTATSNEPQPLLGLLMMDALLRDSGVTSWPITNPEENTKKIQTISDELRDETFAHLDQRIKDNTALATELDNETKQITAEVLLIRLLQDDHTSSNVYIERLYEKDRDVRKQLLEKLPEEKEVCAQWLEENRDSVLLQLLNNIRSQLNQTQQRLIAEHDHTSSMATILDKKVRFLQNKEAMLAEISNNITRERNIKNLTDSPESATEKNDNTASNRFNEDEKIALSKLIQVSTQYSMATQRKLQELRLENTKTQEQRTRLSDILSSRFSKKGSALEFESKTQEALTDPEPTPVIAPSTVSEVLLIVDKIAANKTTIDLSKISPESRTALKIAQESIVEMMAYIENTENIDKKIDWMGNFETRISRHKKNFFQILQEVGFTEESSDVLIQTCCLTNVSDRSLSHQNYVTLIEHWQMIMTQAIGYLDDSTNQEDLGKHPALTIPTQACYQEAMQKQWCQPIINSLDRLLEQDANQNFLYAAPLAEYLSKNNQNLTFPAVCRDLEQADKILDFLQHDSIIAYLLQHNATAQKQHSAFFNCIMGNDFVIERHLERLFANQDQQNLLFDTAVNIINSQDRYLLSRLGFTIEKLSKQKSTEKAHVTKLTTFCLHCILHESFSVKFRDSVIDFMRTIVTVLEEHDPGALGMLTIPDASSGMTPFQKAMEEKNSVLVLALFDFLKERNPDGLIYPDVLHKAVTLPVQRNIGTLIDTIIEIRPACLIIKNSNGMTPLAQAIQDEKFEFIESLSEACKNRYPDELIHNFDNLFDLILQNGRKRSVEKLTKVLHAIQETRPEKLEEIIESKREILRAIQNTQGKRYIGIEEIFDTLLDKRTNTASVSESSPPSGVLTMGLFATGPERTSVHTSVSKEKKSEDPSNKKSQGPHI